jgi:capsular exopolysaccharide synthesis family protein
MAALGLSSLPAYVARPLPNTQLLEITVVDTEPLRAKMVADELANQLVLQSPTAPQPEEQERVAFINQQLASLQANISDTEAQLAAAQQELERAIGAREISDLQSEIAALQTKLTTFQSNYAVLLTNTNSGATNTIQVIEQAILPTVPTGSAKVQLVLLATSIAVALATGTAYLLDYLDDTVHGVDDLARVKGARPLPGIPEFGRASSMVPVLDHGARLTPVADAFRALRAATLKAMPSTPGKVILVTGAAPQEGKSIVAANLAAVIGQGQKTTLLIDADLRRPRQHELFDLPDSDGLAEVLTALDANGSSVSPEALVKRTMHHVGRSCLNVLAAGSDRADGARLLGGDGMKSLLQSASGSFDYVIIDSPPLLAVSDALLLSTQVDGVVLVTRAGTTSRKQLEHALHRLSEIESNILGVVLNRRKQDENYRYYNYYRA